VIYLALGRRELGKSTLAYFMAQRLAKRAVLDPRRMIRRTGERIEYVTTINHARDALWAMMLDGESDEVVYQPSEDDIEYAFVEWTRTLKAIVVMYPERELAIFVDEASFYDLETPTFMWLAKCSLRDYTHIIITAHQPKDVPTGVRAIADHWFIFHTTQETDLAKIAEKSPEAATHAKRLTHRAYVHWDDTRAALAINPNPQSWYVAMRNSASVPATTVTPDAQPAPSDKPLFRE
jgi:hypothetical protein